MDYLVFGLGNPGKEYELTRHNAGFLVVDYLVEQLGAGVAFPDCAGMVARGRWGKKEVLAAKPGTFMNLSEKSLRMLILKYGVPLSRTIIILDDLALPFGAVRLRAGGGTAGHKGLASVLSVTGEDVPRLRVGIGRPPEGMEPADFVLSPFQPEEKKLLPEVLSWAGQAVLTWIDRGAAEAMSRYNGYILSLRGNLPNKP